MKTTYILGAGASANSIPVINQFNNKLQTIKGILESLSFNLNIEPSDKLIIQSFTSNYIDTLIEICKTNPTVDTFAYKLESRGDYKELVKFKKQLSAFLMINQILNGTDLRYDNFIASTLANPLVKTSDNLRVLTWNYDIQFQIAYLNFFGRQYLSDVDNILNVTYNKNERNLIHNKFTIYRLNGICGFKNSNNIHHILNKYELKENDIKNYKNEINHEYNVLIELIRFFNDNDIDQKYDKMIPSISFAFEENSVIEESMKGTHDTDVLVIIGYSFPNYNRQIDINLIKAMKNLKTIYVQDHNKEIVINKIKDITKSLNINIIGVDKNDSEFYIPNEFFEDKATI